LVGDVHETVINNGFGGCELVVLFRIWIDGTLLKHVIKPSGCIIGGEFLE
jgi:hypothetical protein